MLSDSPRRSNDSPDAEVIRQLGNIGSDLNKAHPVEFFFLGFPTRVAAETAAIQLAKADFQVDVHQLPGYTDWSLVATKEMVPALDVIENLRNEFESLARSLGGEFDGWGAPLVD